jgi:hypothetical protein
MKMRFYFHYSTFGLWKQKITHCIVAFLSLCSCFQEFHTAKTLDVTNDKITEQPNPQSPGELGKSPILDVP